MRFTFFRQLSPFAENIFFPDALKVIEHVQQWGSCGLHSLGRRRRLPTAQDQSFRVFTNAVSGRVLIYVHKEQELDEVEKRYPAEHYALVDDKLRSPHGRREEILGSRADHTIFVRQGHYAGDPETILASYPPADISIGRIGDLLQYQLPEILNPKL